MNKIITFLVAITSLLSLPNCAGAQTKIGATGVEYIPGQIELVTSTPIVWDKRNRRAEALSSLLPQGSTVIGCADIPLLRELQTRELASQERYWGTQFLIALPSHIDAESLVHAGIRGELIKAVYLNVVAHTTASAPPSMSDPSFNSTQYELKYDLTAIAFGVHYTGVNHAFGYCFSPISPKIVVAVIDGGANFLHNDFQGSWWVNANDPVNGTDDDLDGYTDDYKGWDFVSGDNDPTDSINGHGAHVSGILAARNNNSTVMCGVVTDSQSLLVLRAGDNSGFLTDFNVTSAYNLAVAKKARVVSMSFGSSSYLSLSMSAIANGIASKVVPVAGSGNSGTLAYYYPASGAHVITVGNDNLGAVRNSSSTYSDSMDIMAVGTSVLSLGAGGTSGTAIKTGTSMATPFIAGRCWGILKMDSSLTVDQVIAKVRARGENHAFSQQTGWGYFSGLDTMCYEALRPDTLVTFTSCTGKHRLPSTRMPNFRLTDSLRYGLPAISGDSINTNMISAGTHTYYMSFKDSSYGQEYRDTFVLKVQILPGSALTPSVTITQTSGTNPMCSGSSMTLTASSTNAGSTPTYQWEKKASAGSWIPLTGATASTYTTTTAAQNDSFRVIMTPTVGGCYTVSTDTSNAIGVVVNPNVVPTVSISANPGNTICVSSSVTFTATPTNGGTTPSYQWRKNGSSVGTNNPTYATSSLANGDIISCVMTTSVQCYTALTDTSQNITMTVNTAPATPGTISGNSSVCASATGLTYSISSVTGATSYTWTLPSGWSGSSTSTSISASAGTFLLNPPEKKQFLYEFFSNLPVPDNEFRRQ